MKSSAMLRMLELVKAIGMDVEIGFDKIEEIYYFRFRNTEQERMWRLNIDNELLEMDNPDKAIQEVIEYCIPSLAAEQGK